MIIKHYRQHDARLKTDSNPRGVHPQGGMTIIAMWVAGMTDSKGKPLSDTHTINVSRCNFRDNFCKKEGRICARINRPFILHSKQPTKELLDIAADRIMEESTARVFEKHPRTPVDVNGILKEVFDGE